MYRDTSHASRGSASHLVASPLRRAERLVDGVAPGVLSEVIVEETRELHRVSVVKHIPHVVRRRLLRMGRLRLRRLLHRASVALTPRGEIQVSPRLLLLIRIESHARADAGHAYREARLRLRRRGP